WLLHDPLAPHGVERQHEPQADSLRQVDQRVEGWVVLAELQPGHLRRLPAEQLGELALAQVVPCTVTDYHERHGTRQRGSLPVLAKLGITLQVLRHQVLSGSRVEQLLLHRYASSNALSRSSACRTANRNPSGQPRIRVRWRQSASNARFAGRTLGTGSGRLSAEAP